MHDEVEVGADLQFLGYRAGGRPCLGLQHPAGGQVGQHQRVGVLVVGQGTGPVPVEVERPEPHRARPHREPEHRPHPRLQRRRGEGDPPGGCRIGQIRLGHDPVLLVGIDAWAFAQGILQLLNQMAYRVGGAQRPAWYVT